LTAHPPSLSTNRPDPFSLAAPLPAWISNVIGVAIIKIVTVVTNLVVCVVIVVPTRVIRILFGIPSRDHAGNAIVSWEKTCARINTLQENGVKPAAYCSARERCPRLLLATLT
jgi:hypothetical protein